jgi:hypothetical protein
MKLINLFKKKVLNQFKVTLLTKDGVKFNVTVRGVNRMEALDKVANDMADGCTITDIGRI